MQPLAADPKALLSPATAAMNVLTNKQAPQMARLGALYNANSELWKLTEQDEGDIKDVVESKMLPDFLQTSLGVHVKGPDGYANISLGRLDALQDAAMVGSLMVTSLAMLNAAMTEDEMPDDWAVRLLDPFTGAFGQVANKLVMPGIERMSGIESPQRIKGRRVPDAGVDFFRFMGMEVNRT
jgi:hypothetical protein